MLYTQLARKREYLAFTRDLELHSWYGIIMNLTLVEDYILLCLICHISRVLMQTVGPSIAISFSVYETLRSYWQSNR